MEMESGMKEFMRERFELVNERISSITDDGILKEPLRGYFEDAALFLTKIYSVINKTESGEIRQMSFDDLKDLNKSLYEDIIKENYDNSYANPDYITSVFEKNGLPSDYAKCLCFVYAEIRGMIPYAFEGRVDIVTLYEEMFVEVYGLFVQAAQDLGKPSEQELESGLVQEVDYTDEGLVGVPDAETVKSVIVSFEQDNCETIVLDRVLDQVDPSRDFAKKIIMESDLTDLRYLYYYGEYITDDEIKMAQYLNTLSEDDIVKMANTYTEGYRIGFVKAGKPLDKKKTVNLRYPVGFERMMRAAIKNFADMHLEPTIYRAATVSLNKNNHFRIGYSGAVANKQFEYDHQDDRALFIDADFLKKRLSILKNCYEDNKSLANTHAGPAVVETFGEDPFIPVPKSTAIKLDENGQRISANYAVEAGTITNEYIIGEERSFTIIAYPVPSIGEKFEEIFCETVKLNTLDYKLYEGIQQVLIDTLDKADSVHIVGKDGNETDLTIKLYEITDPSKQTKFENCVADVNIPVGEVFTSPVLKGTNGLLHVSYVYLEGLLYKNLKIYLKDGCVEKYSCANFPSVAENEKYFKENVLFNHDTLPLGEFAIGTNTTAYKMARDYGIEERLPILIGEKTGPHFALGDTCYSREEDVAVYNPDGKEIVARENDFSRKRSENPNKAYFSCHTDITIPYDELGGIYAMTKNGEIPIIEDGRFVLDGCEELNKPLGTVKNA